MEIICKHSNIICEVFLSLEGFNTLAIPENYLHEVERVVLQLFYLTVNDIQQTTLLLYVAECSAHDIDLLYQSATDGISGCLV